MSQNSGTGQPKHYATFEPLPSRHTTTGGRVTSFAYEVAVFACFRESPIDRCSLCVCRQGLYQEAHSPPVTDTVHATKQRRGRPRHYISRVLQSPLPCPKEVRRLETSHRPFISQLLPRDSPLQDGKCGKHSAISPSRRLGHFHRSCGCLFPHTHPQRLSKISSISDSGHHIPIPGTTVWPFSSTFTKIMTEIKMLVHVMCINICQYLDDWLIYSPSHDQCLRDTVLVLKLCHTMGLLIHDKKSELIPKQKFLFLGYQFELVSFQVTPTLDRYHKIKALIRSFLLSQGGCAHTWQILLGLFAATEKLVPLGRLHTREAQYCISQRWDFDALTSNLWIPGGGRSPIVEVSTQCSDASNIGWGAHWNALTVSGVWTTTEKTLHINVLELEAIHRAMLHWLRKRIV